MEQSVKAATDKTFAIDSDNAIISAAPEGENTITRIRVSFFILGSNQAALGLHK